MREEPSVAACPPCGPARDASVLVVDDDERNRTALCALLSSVEAEVVQARSGAEALAALLRRDFAVILLDVQMPGLDGLETAALIRERERTARTPIIFVTAHARSDDDLRRGYRLGAVDFLTKPIAPEEVLRDKVAWFVASRRTEALRAREAALRREAERAAAERAVDDARRAGEAEALRREMRRQQELVARLHRANERLATLASNAAALLVGGEPLECVPRVLDALGEHLGLELGLLHLAREGGRLDLVVHGGVPRADVETLERLSPAETAFGRAALERTPVFLEDVPRSARDPAVEALGARFAACLPLLVAGRLIGTLTLATRGRAHADAEERLALELTAEQLAAALDRARLVVELQARAEDLAEADRRKDDFLAMLGHELRNPLTPVRNALELLRSDPAVGERGAHAVELASRQLRHVVRLVDDLVDVSRIRTGKVELRRAPIDVLAPVQVAVEALRPTFRAQEQHLRLELSREPLLAEADPVRLAQVLENLLHNASKYTEPGGHALLSAGREGEEIVVRVSDDGMGIAPDLLPRVFEPFVQAHQPPNRRRGGLGLGLTVVRSLVELHGGRISARSDGPGRGSTFEVRLPALPADARLPAGGEPAPRSVARPGNGHARLRVAVVEDNADIRETLRELLQLHGHEVLEAVDGPSGLELVLAETPDVALVDIGLPGMDGYAVAERVRAAGSSVRLVALTGYGRLEDRARSGGVGFDAHLVKPVELDELTRALAGPGVAHPGSLSCPTPPPPP
jgi:signal transduction histidine kinase/DNA-binding response OmpR family regulator